METQTELKEGKGWYFDNKYPIWKCPDCEWLNRYVDTFFEVCNNCGIDHTLDWHGYKTRWTYIPSCGKAGEVKLHPRHKIRKDAEVEIYIVLIEIAKKYNLTLGETMYILAEMIKREAAGLRKIEDREMETDEGIKVKE